MRPRFQKGLTDRNFSRFSKCVQNGKKEWRNRDEKPL